jgi:hypothetical protein
MTLMAENSSGLGGGLDLGERRFGRGVVAVWSAPQVGVIESPKAQAPMVTASKWRAATPAGVRHPQA